MSNLMAGKRGLIMGVANDHSIAWGIAKQLAAEGAELAFTYQGEHFGRRVKPLAASLGSTMLYHCDVEDAASMAGGLRRARSTAWGSARLRRPRHRLLRQGGAQGPLCRHLARELRPHHADLLLLLHRGGAAGGHADAEGRQPPHAHLWRVDAGHAELQRDGRRQGGARSLGALPRRRFRRSAASASTPSPPGRSARSPAPASPTRGSCSATSGTTRRCAARRPSRTSAARRSTC